MLSLLGRAAPRLRRTPSLEANGGRPGCGRHRRLLTASGSQPPTRDSLDGPELPEEEKNCFRSSMGTLLYLSQDRIDIQHAVRNLSQWMSRPTRRAMDGVRHLIQFLMTTLKIGSCLGI